MSTLKTCKAAAVSLGMKAHENKAIGTYTNSSLQPPHLTRVPLHSDLGTYTNPSLLPPQLTSAV